MPLLIEYERQQAGQSGVLSGDILISSASAKVPLLNAVRQAAFRLGMKSQIIAADSDANCLAQYFCDLFWKMPPLAEIENEIELLLELRARHIAFIIPTRDAELSFWAGKRDFLAENNIQVMVSAPVSIAYCLDKLAFDRQCQILGVPAIPTAETIDTLATVTRYVVKERYGAGSLQIGLCLSRVDALKHAEILAHPIFQPYIKGEEYSIDAYVTQNGTVKGLICRCREVVRNGESHITATVSDARLEQACRQYIESLNLYGHVMLQLLLDDEGGIHLIECNARFGGASTLSLAAGLDSFFWFFLEAGGADIAAVPFAPVRNRLRQVRIAQDFVFPMKS